MNPIIYFTPVDQNNPFNNIAQAIINSECANRKPGSSPIGLLTIGAPGSGKTTLIRALAAQSGGDIFNIPDIIRSSIQRGYFLEGFCVPKGVRSPYNNAIYIEPTKYREAIAEEALRREGFIRGRDYALADGSSPPEEKSAMAYITGKNEFSVEAKQAYQTGSEIARILLIRSAEEGIPWILDTTGGGFASQPDQTTIPLMEAASKSNARLYFLRLDTPLDIAIGRSERDYRSGNKYFYDAARIRDDYDRGVAAVDNIKQYSADYAVAAMVVTMNEKMEVDRNRIFSPNLDRFANEAGQDSSRKK